MEKHKCDKCDRPATYHSVEIVNGKKIEKHLCEYHAAEEGLTFKVAHKPINELLTNFVKMHSQDQSPTGLVCDHCGLTYAEFQERSLLGCPSCYQSFARPLDQLLARTHEGATEHQGKIPAQAGFGEQHQQQLLRMRKRLSEAVDAEDYELAAHLRDEISKITGVTEGEEIK
ncbi:MAG: UvrB/UvrC motif-containing protein [Phycisphaeraceae bacterium]|nr:UvrB/UvrC motif-containing protein [Phycisphaeraceae bacterium]